MTMTLSRASRLASICHKEFDFQFFVYQQEVEYKAWLGRRRLTQWINHIPVSDKWNCVICSMTIFSLLLTAIDPTYKYILKGYYLLYVFDIVFNVVYGVHSVGMLYTSIVGDKSQSYVTKSLYLVDVISYLHYVALYFHLTKEINLFHFWIIKNVCYYLRLHRPIKFLWNLQSQSLMGSVIGSTLMCVYLFWLLRIFFSFIWSVMYTILVSNGFTLLAVVIINNKADPPTHSFHDIIILPEGVVWRGCEFVMWEKVQMGSLEVDYGLMPVVNESMYNTTYQAYEQGKMYYGLQLHYKAYVTWTIYVVDKIFIPIGPVIYPKNYIERLMSLLVMFIGTMACTGVAVAFIAIILSVALRNEEAYRARFRLIMKDLNDTRVPSELRSKVETFYKMYWHTQKGVSKAHLMKIIPPTLSNSIYSEIFFEAQQKSTILRDLSTQFLCELAKVMTTINYIPGDPIIKRKSPKSSIIYIAYGDVEMLTAEDDMTPMLRFCRGTVLNSCGGCPEAGCALSEVEIRAATFCTAHVLRASDLWKIILKYGKTNGQAFIVLSAFEEHFERIKRHYAQRPHVPVKHKSTIVFFKRNLIGLKEAKDPSGRLLLDHVDVFLEIAGCYIMRNTPAGASLVVEADEVCLKSSFPCILQQSSTLQTAWNTFVCCCIFVVSVTHPYYLVHSHDPVTPEFRFYDFMMTIIFTLDVITHLSTGSKIEEGVPITFKHTSCEQMKTVWFGLDILAAMPILEFVEDGQFIGLNKLIKLPKLFKTLKALEHTTVYHSNLLRFLSYTLLILIASYLIGSVQQGFMCYYYDLCALTSMKKLPYWEKKTNNTSNGTYLRMMYGLYWAINMMSLSAHPFGGWGITEWQYRLYTMVMMEVCLVLRIFISGVYAATVMVSLTMRQEFEACIKTVKKFLTRNDVEPILLQRFISYLQLHWHIDRAYSITHKKQPLLHDLPPHVFGELLTLQRNKYIQGIPFMKYLQSADVEYVSSRARLFYCNPNEIILNTGDLSNEMYVIKQGICEVYDPDRKKLVRVLGAKENFGVLECLLRMPTFYTVRSITHVQLLSISNKYFTTRALNVMKQAIVFTRKQPEFARLQRRRAAFLKYELTPATGNRKTFPLPKKYEADTNFLQPFYRLGFLSILRYVFPRWTIRPDGPYMKYYEYFRAFCAVLSSFVAPCATYMNVEYSFLMPLLHVLDFTAYFDMFQRLLVSYYDEKGILIYHPASTALHYLKGPFIVDLLASVPMENLGYGANVFGYGGLIRRLKTPQQLMFNRLLQLYRVPNALSSLSTWIHRQDILLIIQFLPFFLALINCMTSNIFYDSIQLYVDPIKENVFQFHPLRNNSKENTWVYMHKNVFRFDILGSPTSLHLAIYFWVIYLVTGSGIVEFYPTDLDLISNFYFGMIASTMMLTYLSVCVISIRADVNQALASFQEQMKDINAYMNRENVPEDLRREVYEYYTYSWDKMGGTDYRSVLRLCDQITLRTDTIVHIYGPTFQKCPVLTNCDLSLIRALGRSVHNVYLLRDTNLIEKDDCISHFYFVDYGTVDVKDAEDSNNVITKLPKGSMFGNLEGKNTVRISNGFSASSNVHLLRIRSEDFFRMLRDYPMVKRQLLHFRPHNTENYIIGGQKDSGKALKVWKERALSTAIILTSKKGYTKYFSAHAKPLHVYLILVSLAVVFLDIYNAAFENNTMDLIIALYTLDGLFLLKILINHAIANIDSEKDMKVNLLSVRQNYYKEEFKFDVLSLIPIELFCFAAPHEDMWRVFGYLRLNRIFRLFTVKECIKRHHEKLKINLVLSNITSLVIWFTVVLHSMTCMWYFIGNNIDRHKPNSSWMFPDAHVPKCDFSYTCSLYFSLSMFLTNGAGDIMPKWEAEVFYVICLQLFSTMLYMIYVGEFANIIQYQSFRFFSFYTSYLEFMQFLKSNRVTANLVLLAERYSLHLWREARGVQMPYFLTTAPQYLHTKIMNAAFAYHLKQNPVFGNCEKAFLRQLARHLRFYFYDEGMYIVKENEITDSMYIIHKGRVEEHDEELEAITQILKTGDHFGMGLNRGIMYTHSYRAITKAEVLTLRLQDWEYLLNHFPNSKVSILDTTFDEEAENYRDKESKRQNLIRGRTQVAQEQDVPERSTRFPTTDKEPPASVKSPSSTTQAPPNPEVSVKKEVSTQSANPQVLTPILSDQSSPFPKYPTKRYSDSEFQEFYKPPKSSEKAKPPVSEEKSSTKFSELSDDVVNKNSEKPVSKADLEEKIPNKISKADLEEKIPSKISAKVTEKPNVEEKVPKTAEKPTLRADMDEKIPSKISEKLNANTNVEEEMPITAEKSTLKAALDEQIPSKISEKLASEAKVPKTAEKRTLKADIDEKIPSKISEKLNAMTNVEEKMPITAEKSTLKADLDEKMPSQMSEKPTLKAGSEQQQPSKVAEKSVAQEDIKLKEISKIFEKPTSKADLDGNILGKISEKPTTSTVQDETMPSKITEIPISKADLEKKMSRIYENPTSKAAFDEKVPRKISEEQTSATVDEKVPSEISEKPITKIDLEEKKTRKTFEKSTSKSDFEEKISSKTSEQPTTSLILDEKMISEKPIPKAHEEKKTASKLLGKTTSSAIVEETVPSKISENPISNADIEEKTQSSKLEKPAPSTVLKENVPSKMLEKAKLKAGLEDNIMLSQISETSISSVIPEGKMPSKISEKPTLETNLKDEMTIQLSEKVTKDSASDQLSVMDQQTDLVEPAISYSPVSIVDSEKPKSSVDTIAQSFQKTTSATSLFTDNLAVYTDFKEPIDTIERPSFDESMLESEKPISLKSSKTHKSDTETKKPPSEETTKVFPLSKEASEPSINDKIIHSPQESVAVLLLPPVVIDQPAASEEKNTEPSILDEQDFEVKNAESSPKDNLPEEKKSKLASLKEAAMKAISRRQIRDDDDEERDTYTKEVEEAAAKDLMSRGLGPSDYKLSRSRSDISTLDIKSKPERKMSQISRLNLRTFTAPTFQSRKSVLSFRDNVTTFEVPLVKDVPSLVSVRDGTEKQESTTASIFAYADDIAMKDPKITQSVSTDILNVLHDDGDIVPAESSEKRAKGFARRRLSD